MLDEEFLTSLLGMLGLKRNWPSMSHFAATG